MKIVIPGIPVPQARMKHSAFGGFVKTYDPKAKQKKDIRYLLQGQGSFDDAEFLRISFLFHMPIPSGIRKKEVELYESGFRKHNKKPDVDNLIKLYLDCLDGIVIFGDQKVALGPCIKVYHREPKTIMLIQQTHQILEDWEFPNEYVSEP